MGPVHDRVAFCLSFNVFVDNGLVDVVFEGGLGVPAHEWGEREGGWP